MRLYNIIWYDLGGVLIWKLEKVTFPRTERDTLKINVIVLKNVSVWLNTTTIQYNWNPTSPMFERRRPHSDGGKRKILIGLQYCRYHNWLELQLTRRNKQLEWNEYLLLTLYDIFSINTTTTSTKYIRNTN